MQSIIERAEKLGIKIPHIRSEEINKQIKPVLRKMEKVGIRLDCDALKKLSSNLEAKQAKTERIIYKLAGEQFNISSPSQIAEILFRKLKLPTNDLQKIKSGVSTAASELRKIEKEHKIIAPILEYRELSKLISTYLKPLPILIDKDSRIHTTYGLETSTGRITSSEPNLQNIPIKGEYGEDIRRAFVPTPGMKLISADYSQIELRVVACLAKDKSMIEAFKRGDDIHAKTAADIFKISAKKVTKDQRRVAKTVNFGIVYGVSPYGLSQSLGVDTSEATKYIFQYFEAHQGIKLYINDMIKMAHEEGYVETLFGTKRYLPNINSHMRYVAEGEERMAINMPVQGTAAEILKLAMIELDKKLSKIDHARMLLTIHDELVVEVEAKEAKRVARIVKEIMEEVVKLCVPIEVSVGIGDNWADAK